jgi:DNA polymerase III sliding clamp (beta) subunit (PCNA family)
MGWLNKLFDDVLGSVPGATDPVKAEKVKEQTPKKQSAAAPAKDVAIVEAKAAIAKEKMAIAEAKAAVAEAKTAIVAAMAKRSRPRKAAVITVPPPRPARKAKAIAPANTDSSPLAVTFPTPVPPPQKPEKAGKTIHAEAPISVPSRQGDARIVLPQSSLRIIHEVCRAMPKGRQGQQARVVFTHGRMVSKKGGYEFYATTLDECACVAETNVAINEGGTGEMLIARDLIKSMHDQKPVLVDIVRRGLDLDVDVYRTQTQVASLKVETESAEDFPMIVRPPLGAVAVQGLFAAILEAKQFCHEDAGRYAMNAVSIDAENSCVVATDGKRLHWIPFKHPGLPFKQLAVAMTMKLPPGKPFVPGKEEVVLDQKSDIFYVLFPNGYWASRTVREEFPPWQDVMPHYLTYAEWRLGDSSRRRAIEVIKNMPVGRGDGALALLLELGEDFVRFSAQEPGKKYEFKLEKQTVVFVDWDDEKLRTLTIGFNPGLLLDILHNERLDVIRFKDSKSAGLFLGDHLKHVLMPIQVV